MSLNETRVLVLHPDIKQLQKDKKDVNSSLTEAVSLAKSLNVNVVKQRVINISAPRSGYLFGKGATEKISLVINKLSIDLVIINGDISPIQQRNLEKNWQVKLIDRTHLILEIFSDRAATREGVLQVELATLSYQRTRLVRSWTHLERQRGGLGFVGGPGETQIESDRRAINNAILKIKSQLSKVVSTRLLHRRSREKKPYPIVALIGYTNAGKSTLFNKLTNSKVFVKNMPFATLDPTMRLIELTEKSNIILSDTVGFISGLPTELIAAFRSTLEEITNADLIIHVRDISDKNNELHKLEVYKVLESLGLETDSNEKLYEVHNKIDLLTKDELNALKNLSNRNEKSFLISSTCDIGFDKLITGIDTFINRGFVSENIKLGFDEAYLRSKLYDASVIMSEKQTKNGFEISVRWSDKKRGEFYSLIKNRVN